MHPPEQDSRLVSGEGPVNRRTALQQERSHGGSALKREPHPHLQERMERVHARNQFGVSLQEHLASSRTSEQPPASGVHIALGVVAACGGLLALLGAIQSSMALVAAGFSIAACGALGWKVVHRKANKAASPQGAAGTPPAPLFDPQTLAVFDAAVEKAAAELDENCAERLLAIKEAFKRMGNQSAAHDEHFTVEDRLYLRECLRRYVPDSLQAYLRVPVAQRLEPLLNNQPCAQTALLEQLDMLLEEVRLREKKMGRSAAGQLVRQQQFLASKKSR